MNGNISEWLDLDLSYTIPALFEAFRFCLAQIAASPLALVAAGCAICAAAVAVFYLLAVKQ